MSSKLKFVFLALVFLTSGASMAQTSAPAPKEMTTIWPRVPFFALGDLGQYEKTMAQDRTQARKMFWNELMGALQQFADSGAVVEMMVKPLASVLMMFDQAHDIHKAQDVINIDKSLEARFKASLDRLFTVYDVREDRRRVEFSYGAEDGALLESTIRGLAAKQPLGKPLSEKQLSPQVAGALAQQIDVVAYGTFSNLGRGQFQVTLHLTGQQTGVTRSFVAVGGLSDAIDNLAQQVFDLFQKNVYPDWETPEKHLQWLPMPVNVHKEDGYTWEEARQYCRARGYRLPYSRELLLAETGGAYKVGGITALLHKRAYAVADKRSTNENYVLTPGNEDATGGAVQAVSFGRPQGFFWCVKGKASSEVQIFETVWELIRKYRGHREIYRALETVRYELGDFGSNADIYWGPSLIRLERMQSLKEALNYLKSQGIRLNVPQSLNEAT